MALKEKIIELETFNVAKKSDMEKLVENSEYSDKLSMVLLGDLSQVRGGKELVEQILEFEKDFIKQDEDLTLLETEFINFLEDQEDQEEREEQEEYEEDREESYFNEFEVDLNINSVGVKTESCYTVKSQYPSLLELKSFYDACARKRSTYSKEVKEKLKKSFSNVYYENREILGYKKNKYRMIKVDEKQYIRAILSTGYRDYNNLIAVYIGLCTINKLGLVNNEHYKIKHGIITDSDIMIKFSGLSAKKIKDVGEMSLEIVLRNNELGKGSMILSVDYCIKIEGKEMNLNTKGMDGKINNKIFSITHSSGIENVLSRINEGTKSTETFEEELKAIMFKIKNTKITDAFINRLIKSVLEAKLQKLSKTAKEKIRAIEDTLKITKNVLDLYGEFSKLNLEFGEKEYMDSLFYKMLKEWRV